MGVDIIDNVLAKDINGLEPRLTREGYNTKVLAELLNAKPREIKAFLRGQLAPGSDPGVANRAASCGNPALIYILAECEPTRIFSSCSQFL